MEHKSASSEISHWSRFIQSNRGLECTFYTYIIAYYAIFISFLLTGNDSCWSYCSGFRDPHQNIFKFSFKLNLSKCSVNAIDSLFGSSMIFVKFLPFECNYLVNYWLQRKMYRTIFVENLIVFICVWDIYVEYIDYATLTKKWKEVPLPPWTHSPFVWTFIKFISRLF